MPESVPRSSLASLGIRVLDFFVLVFGVIAIVGLFLQFFYKIGQSELSYLFQFLNFVVYLFAGQEYVRLALHKKSWAYLQGRRLELFVSFLVLLFLIFPNNFLSFFALPLNKENVNLFTLIYIGFSQMVIIGIKLLRWFGESEFFAHLKMHPSKLLILSFAFLGGLGAFLLSTPQASTVKLPWVDHLFNAISALCVTGLSTVEVADTYTRIGQFVLMVLMQMGGLGIMTFALSLSYMAGGMGVRDRFLLGQLLSHDNLSELGKILLQVFMFTFVVQAIGGFFLYQAKYGDYWPSSWEPLFDMVFHTISSFCNAGFLLHPKSMEGFFQTGNYFYLYTVICLMFAGSLGFPVVMSFWRLLKYKFLKRTLRPATLSMRLTLLSHLTFWVLGAFLIWLLGKNFVFAQMNGHQQFLQSVFLSTTARTTGLSIIDIGVLPVAMVSVLLFLMFVGGSPFSTAGGIKNITFWLLLVHLKNVFLPHRIGVFKRRIPEDTLHRAFAIFFLTILINFFAFIWICLLEPKLNHLDILFEVVSAMSTTGLSRGITGALSEESKLIITSLMFIGRVGVFSFVIGFLPVFGKSKVKYIEEDVVIL